MAGRMLGLAIVVGLAGGCGGSGGGGGITSPGLTLPVTLSLPDGNYILTIYSSGLTCLTMSPGNDAPLLASVSGDVRITADSSGWKLATASAAGGTMTGSLARTLSGVSGTLDGRLVDTTVSVDLEHQALSGSSSIAGSGLAGGVTGSVTYVGKSSTSACSGNSWNLLPK